MGKKPNNAFIFGHTIFFEKVKLNTNIYFFKVNFKLFFLGFGE